jgi:hypothetical protein
MGQRFEIPDFSNLMEQAEETTVDIQKSQSLLQTSED